jgi:hypothetical protein
LRDLTTGNDSFEGIQIQEKQENHKENSMRNLVALAALLGFLPVANAADAKGEVSHNAEYRVRYQIDQARAGDSDNNTIKHTANHRFKLDLGYRSGEKFGAHFTLLHNATWGDVGDNAGGPPSQTPSGVANSANMALVNQAYGTWMLNDSWFLKFGRGGMTLADGSVTSQNDWESTPNAFEGILVNWEHEMLRLNLFAVKAGENMTVATGNDDPELNFYGAAIDIKNLPEFLRMVNLHFMQINGDENGVAAGFPYNAGRDEMRYGVVISGDMAGVDFKLNYAAHSGQYTKLGVKSDIDGNMMGAEVGFSMPEMMKSRVYFGYHADSGDSDNADTTKIEGYSSFFYEKHCNSGCMDVVAWGNLTFMKAGYTFSPLDQVDVGLHYWKFQRTESAIGADRFTAGNNGTAYTTAAASLSGSDDIGSEIDLAATKKYDSGFSVTATLGMFMPGAYLKDEGNLAVAPVKQSDTFNQLFVEGKMTF